jgi:hypothetical protein
LDSIEARYDNKINSDDWVVKNVPIVEQVVEESVDEIDTIVSPKDNSDELEEKSEVKNEETKD